MINSVLDKSRSFLSQSGVLRGGRALVHWKREVSHQTQRLGTVFLTCQWVKEIAEVNPSFFYEPLLGNCLAEITSRGPREAEIEKQPSQVAPQLPRRALLSGNIDRKRNEGTTSARRVAPQLPRRALLSGNIDRMRNEGTASARAKTTGRVDTRGSVLSSRRKPSEPKSREQRDRVSQLPLQANGSLLKRFAGPIADVSGQLKVQSSNILPRPRSRARSPVPEEPGQALRQQEWRRQIADRATNTWLRDWPKTLAASTSSAFEEAKMEASTPAISTSPLLQEQWSTSLSGQRASPEVFVQLLKHFRFNGSPTASAVKHASADLSGLGNSLPAQFPVLTDITSARQRPLGNKVPPASGMAAFKTFETILPERYQPDRLYETNRDFFADPAQPPATDGGEWRLASDVAPPVLRSSLPPLLPASAGSAGLPIAAETARQGARRDEMNAQEKDLGLLAAQMKRILDEEARRHGIDV